MRPSRRAPYRATSITSSPPPARSATYSVRRLLLSPPHSTRTCALGPGRLHHRTLSHPAVTHECRTIVSYDRKIHQRDQGCCRLVAFSRSQRGSCGKLPIASRSRPSRDGVGEHAVRELRRRLQGDL